MHLWIILSDSKFISGHYNRPDVSDAWLNNSTFSNLKLSSPVFEGADIRGINFDNCITSNPKFDNAIVDDSTWKYLQSFDFSKNYRLVKKYNDYSRLRKR